MRFDPGPCPICGVAHTACTADSGPVVVVQMPARDAAADQTVSGPLVADQVQATLPPGSFTSATYRGDPKKRTRSA